jgi:hypothetical protein
VACLDGDDGPQVGFCMISAKYPTTVVLVAQSARISYLTAAFRNPSSWCCNKRSSPTRLSRPGAPSDYTSTLRGCWTDVMSYGLLALTALTAHTRPTIPGFLLHFFPVSCPPVSEFRLHFSPLFNFPLFYASIRSFPPGAFSFVFRPA